MIFSNSRETGRFGEVVDVAESDQRRFSLNDEDLETLARYALAIESHYQRPMDIEWGVTATVVSFTYCRHDPKPYAVGNRAG